MAGMNIVERRRPQDGQLTTEIDGIQHRRPGGHCLHDLGREVRAADPGQEPLGPAPRRSGHAGRHARDLLEADPGALRHGAVRRTDRERQDHHALRHAHRGQRSRTQRHDDRGPGRVHLSLHQPDPDQRAGGSDLRHRIEVDPAPGPRRDPRRRDPRRRDRPDRRPVGPDGALRALLAARHRLGLGAAPLLGHGDRVVPDRLLGPRHRRPAPGAPDLPLVQDPLLRRPTRN